MSLESNAVREAERYAEAGSRPASDADLANARKAEADARMSWDRARHALDAAQLAAGRVRSGQR